MDCGPRLAGVHDRARMASVADPESADDVSGLSTSLLIVEKTIPPAALFAARLAARGAARRPRRCASPRS